uniref:Uncharacterized protein n=1 Tax=Oryza glumipatula TaxID=40148 RepID=A0A0D9ZKG4_9ORYZ
MSARPFKSSTTHTLWPSAARAATAAATTSSSGVPIFLTDRTSQLVEGTATHPMLSPCRRHAASAPASFISSLATVLHKK